MSNHNLLDKIMDDLAHRADEHELAAKHCREKRELLKRCHAYDFDLLYDIIVNYARTAHQTFSEQGR